MKKMFQEFTDYLDREKINKREWGYYLMAMVGTLLVGLVPCAYPLVMLGILFISLKYIFPLEPEK